MPIAEDTRRLCDDIASSRFARHKENAEREKSVGQFLKGARRFLKEAGNNHSRMGKELRASLAESERQRLDAAFEFASALAAGTKERTREVGRMLAGFGEELADFGRDNNRRAAAVREFLGEVREDMLAAGAAWRGIPGKLSRPFPPAPPESTKNLTDLRAGPTRNDKERDIFNVVMGHPRGLKLTDIGKSLGADWRSLNAPTRSLVAAGKLRKVDNLYFAVQH